MLEDMKNTLQGLGLKKHDIQVYLVCFEHKEGLFVAQIAKLTGIKRSTVNLILDRLHEKGFVTYHLDGARKLYRAEEPESLLLRFEESVNDFKALIPLLRAAGNSFHKTKIRFFEGHEGTAHLFRDVLQTMKLVRDPRKEVLAITSGKDIFTELPEHQKQFIDKRVRAQLPTRIIASDDPASRALQRNGTREFRTMKFFDPKKYPFKIEINIYANSVAFINFDDALSSVIVENKILAQSFKSLFNLLWDSLP